MKQTNYIISHGLFYKLLVVGEGGVVGRVVLEHVMGAHDLDQDVAIAHHQVMGEGPVLDHLQIPKDAIRIDALVSLP